MEHSLLFFDTGTCLIIVLPARQLWGGRAALLAGLFYAVHLPIIYYGANIEQFTSALPLVFLWFYLFSSWDLGSPKKWIPWALGLVSGVLMLNKTVYLPVTLASLAGIVWLKRKAPSVEDNSQTSLDRSLHRSSSSRALDVSQLRCY